MSLTIIGKHTRVRIGGEMDEDGMRGFVLLDVTPKLALLARREARDVARTLVRFAERVRSVKPTRKHWTARPDPGVVGDTARMFRNLTTKQERRT